MAGASATVTVKKQGFLFPRYEATVTLPAGAAIRNFAWMDARGRQGTVSLDDMLATHWSDFTAQAAENGVKPLLAFSYAEEGDADKTVFVDVSKVAKNADGTYSLSGQLMADAPAQEGRVDAWDYLGINYKSSYERFLNASGLKDCKSGTVCSSVSAVGILAATTFSVASAVEAGYHDYPLPKPGAPNPTATQLSPGQLGAGTISTTTNNGQNNNNGGGFGNGGSTDTTQMTALIPYSSGGTFLTATNLNSTSPGLNNGVNLYAATSPTGESPTWGSPAVIVQGSTTSQASSFNSPVVAMLEYDIPQYDDSGNLIGATFASIGGGATSPIPMTLGGPIIGTGSISNGTTPATFTGSVSGTTLTVNSVASGTIALDSYVVGGPANNTQIKGFGTGSGGAGTYTVTPAQTWPASGTATMTAGVGGSTMLISLAEGVVASSLVGATVTGANVAPNTTISSYSSTTGGVSRFTVNTYNIVGSEELTIGTSAPVTFNGGISAGQGTNSPGNVLQIQVPVQAAFEGSVGSVSGSTAVLTASTVTGALKVGQYVQGLDPGSAASGSASITATITSLGSGTGGAGTYNLSLQNAPSGYTGTSGAMAACTSSNCGVPAAPTEVTYIPSDAATATTAAIDQFLGVFPGANPGTYVATYTLADNADGSPYSALVGAVPGNVLSLSLAPGQSPWDLVGQSVQGIQVGDAVATPLGTITGIVDAGTGSGGNVTYTVSQNIAVAGGTSIQTYQNTTAGSPTMLATVNPGAVIALQNGDVYYYGSTCETSAAGCSGGQNLIQLASGLSGGGATITTLVSMANVNGQPGFAVGESNGAVWRFDSTIAPDGTLNTNGMVIGFTRLTGGTMPSGSITAMVASPGGVTVGTDVGIYQYSGTSWSQLGSGSVSALLPYDNVQLVGAIGGTPVLACTGTSASSCGAPGGNIVAPSYLNTLETNAPYLKPLVQGCQSGYDNGSGSGCNGYLLTVQQVSVSGTLLAGQKLYGGAGLASGTTIKSQLSDSTGALCSTSCSAGGAGVYVVDRYQLVAPGTPMSASNGSGVIAGFEGCASTAGCATLTGYGSANGLTLGEDWKSSTGAGVTAIVPWRDGLAVGLNYYAYSSNNGPEGFNDGSNYYTGGVYSWRPTLTSSWQSYTGQFDNGWTMLQGPNNLESPNKGNSSFGPGWNAPVTSMTPFGDGFAVGLNPPFGDGGQTGMVGLWTPFEDLGAAFGYTRSGTEQTTTFTAASCSAGSTGGVNSTGSCSANFNQISNPGGSDGFATGACANTCSNGAGTIQQMFSFDQIISVDGSGQPCTSASTTCGNALSHTLVVGATNNAIYSYNSATQVWTQLQAPDTSSYPPPLTGTTPSGGASTGDVTLQDALNWGRSMSAALGTGGSPVWDTTLGLCMSSTTCAPTVNGVPTPKVDPLSQITTALPYGDPIFGLTGATAGNTPTTPSALQAYCGSECSSHGDYIPIFDYTPGIGSQKLSVGATKDGYGTEVEFVINSLTYGYLFSPNGIIDKFIPGKYSVGIVTAVQAGPQVSLTFPSPLTAAPPTLGPVSKTLTVGHTWETEVGSFSLSTGADLSVSASFIGLAKVPDDCTTASGATSCTVVLTAAGVTTGLLYSWNPYVKSGNGGRMNMSFADFYSTYLDNFSEAVVAPTVSPYLQAEYGLFTPPSTPLIGKWSVFDLGVGYKNPITVPLTVDNGGDPTYVIKSKGDINTFAQFIPNVTKALSWSHDWQVYSDKWGPFNIGTNSTGS
jgi:hypothetical protein